MRVENLINALKAIQLKHGNIDVGVWNPKTMEFDYVKSCGAKCQMQFKLNAARPTAKFIGLTY